MTCVKVELLRQNRKAGVTLFAMNKITQDTLRKQAIVEYSLKHGVTKAAVRYKTSRQNIYRWRKRYDGTPRSLADRSHRPHSHRNQHRPDEIKLIDDMRRRNPNAGLVVFWVKLRQRGYTRSISGLYRFLRKRGQMAEKLPNPKYIPKPYEKMDHPGQRVQIDVKYVPAACLVGDASTEANENGGHYYQYTFIDEYSRFRYLEAFKDHNSYSSTQFILHCIKRVLTSSHCLKQLWRSWESSTSSFGHIRQDITERSNGAIEKTMNTSMLPTSSFRSRTTRINLRFGTVSIISFPCVRLIGNLLNRSYLLFLMCNTSLTNLHRP